MRLTFLLLWISTSLFGQEMMLWSNAPATPSLITDGLILHLDASDPASYPGSGTTWFDISGNSYNGTLYNNVTYSTDAGGSFVFDGTGDQIITSMNESLNNVTLSGWFRREDALTVSAGMIMNRVGSSVCGLNHNSRFTNSLGYHWHTTRYYDNSTGLSIPLNQWIFVAMAVTPNQMIMYKYDGGSLYTYVANLSFAMPISWSDVRIGLDEYNSSRCWDGKIGAVYMYNRALSSSEVEQNYIATKSRYGL